MIYFINSGDYESKSGQTLRQFLDSTAAFIADSEKPVIEVKNAGYYSHRDRIDFSKEGIEQVQTYINDCLIEHIEGISIESYYGSESEQAKKDYYSNQ